MVSVGVSDCERQLGNLVLPGSIAARRSTPVFNGFRSWIQGFPGIHLLSLSPEVVIFVWKAIAAATYISACVAMFRSDPTKRLVWDGLSFALFTVLEPFCPKSGMISLGPAALIAAALYSVQTQAVRSPRETVAHRLFLSACALSFLGAVTQYEPMLRMLLAWGLDFYSTLLLLAALSMWTLRPRSTL